MVVQLLVVVGANVPAGKDFLQVFEEGRIDGHHVFEMPVERAILDHDDLALLFHDRRFDLADLFIEQDAEVGLAVEDRLARLAHAARAKRICLARITEGGLGLFPRFQKRLIRPARRK